MDEYAGRVLADRYRLPLLPSDEYELAETRAFDTYSGQEVLVRQVPLPEIVEAEVVDADGSLGAPASRRGVPGRAARSPADPSVLRAMEAAQAAAQIPDHPRLDQVFDVFAEAGSLWIVSERVAARPLAALLAERPLSPYRAAEVASDVLTALMVLHAHGWTHRNITVRTVLVCEDGRVVLTGLAAGAAEEALCGYSPVPQELPEQLALESADAYEDHEDHEGHDSHDDYGHDEEGEPGEPVEAIESSERLPYPDPGEYTGYTGYVDHIGRPGADDHADQDGYGTVGGDGTYGGYDQSGGYDGGHGSGYDGDDSEDQGGRSGQDGLAGYGEYGAHGEVRPVGRSDAHEMAPDPGLVRPYAPRTEPGPAGGLPDARAARAGAIAAYRAGARAAARISEEQQRGGPPVQTGNDPDWWARKPGEPVPGFTQRHPDDTDAGDHDDSLGDAPYGDDRDGYGTGGPGQVRLIGSWQDNAFPGQDGPPPLPAGGGFEPRHNPHRDSDPYGVRQLPPEEFPAQGTAQSAPGQAAGDGRGHGGGHGSDAGSTARALPAPRTPSTPARPATGGWDSGGAGHEALRADAQRQSVPAVAPPAPVGWDEVRAGADAPVHRGPATPLAAERARQARIAVVGPVTERWAPEQAGPVHENWQLAAPVGPATDLWALGALLYRSVQGHAPYPEENAAELVQLVCSEPPAYAEECGPLRPVVESLLRQDPTERPDFEELRGWLRSLVRSAPEPEAGVDVVQIPAAPPMKPDSSRLPVLRRRGELVRRRRTNSDMVHGRHRHKKQKKQRRGPRTLGRMLLLLIFLLLAGAIAYALFFLPKADEQDRGAPPGSTAPQPSASGQSPEPSGTKASTAPEPSGSPRSQQPQTSATAGDLPAGHVLRKDSEDFQVVVDKSWQRRPINDIGQVRYSNGDFTLIVVPGRDSVQANGDDPLLYQQDKERELQPFRDSSWTDSSGLRRIEVGQRVMAEGQYFWEDSNGRQVFVRNLAMIHKGRYHVVQVIGPEEQRDKVNEAYREAADSYRPAG
ncbi:protein kinase [Streptomyces albipurpureus]|uniref:Protein kinase n=1 Tax=Streptomyces albipurpureus TaxID=2897419 RepID=A0ABT0UMH4_9ACTN|nr:protein kinase [Streptomyces sp. CWNU-1]MCM2389421.1 protein kinase [Streptomyces sp. CWNU-1]